MASKAKSFEEILAEEIANVSPVGFNAIELGAIKKAVRRLLTQSKVYVKEQSELDLLEIILEDVGK